MALTFFNVSDPNCLQTNHITTHLIPTQSQYKRYSFQFFLPCTAPLLCQASIEKTQVVQYSLNMATATAVLTPARVNSALMSSSSKTQRRVNKVRQIVGLNSYGGLKAHNSVLSLGLPVTTEQCFATVVNSLRAKSGGKRRGGGGALSATCSKVDEIFQIAAILNGLTLIGVAVGFVLLRIEASVEESQ
ncbi:uncharacterized protein LOC120008903 [Tripterygium wilfordii]|uniref:uncharacterized protein LOC120008903 n=1 Tax=Tripterygium wilfordii TaxID=458696 RepID=UPI0018F7F1E3|nr:uncharacterized protein LOC120008903 [Tripterygium wilfordii]